MEQRALVILFNGNDISDEQVGKICGIISKYAITHPEDVIIKKFEEDDLAKLLAKTIIAQHSHCKNEDRVNSLLHAAQMISKEFPIQDDIATVISFGRSIPEIYGRIKYGKAIQHDIDTIENIKSILNNVGGTAALIKFNGTKETKNIIRKIFYNYFDEEGTAR